MKKEMGKILTRYVHYDYDISEVLENTITHSINGIENLRKNFICDSDEIESQNKKEDSSTSKQFLSMFSKALNIKDKNKPKEIKFEKLSRIELRLKKKVDDMIYETPFKHFLLLEDLDQLEFQDKGVFKDKEDEKVKKDAEGKSAKFIQEFTNLIHAIGGKFLFKNLR